ncbi:MAG: CBS domain-containing protein [Anaerolineae bacterium]
MLVRDVMHRGVVTCSLDMPLRDVAQRMAQARCSAVVVVDSAGEVAGIISCLDIARAYVENRLDMHAEEMMKTDVVTIVPDIPVKTAVQLMLDHDVQQLVILHARPSVARPVGMISVEDVVRYIAGGAE